MKRAKENMDKGGKGQRAEGIKDEANGKGEAGNRKTALTPRNKPDFEFTNPGH